MGPEHRGRSCKIALAASKDDGAECARVGSAVEARVFRRLIATISGFSLTRTALDPPKLFKPPFPMSYTLQRGTRTQPLIPFHH